MTKKQMKQRLKAYENALVNIWRLNGRYHSARYSTLAFLHDPRWVAMQVLMWNDVKLYNELLRLNPSDLTIGRKGRVKPARKV